MAKSLDLLRNHLAISKVKILIGGSMGGQQALEWAIQQPTVFEYLLPIATNAQHSPWGIAFNESQRLAIQADSTWEEEHSKAGMKGLQAARAMAMVSYRNYETYQATQTDIDTDKIDKFSASSYQAYQGEKLTHRFDAFAYWTLSKAMDSHNVGRNRGGVESALSKIRAKTLVVGITSDVLFPIREQVRIAKYIPNANLATINSTYGHDGFLIEFE
jgi:homoserine O-acetyltransferase